MAHQATPPLLLGTQAKHATVNVPVKAKAVAGPAKGTPYTDPSRGTFTTDAQGGISQNSIPTPQPLDPGFEQQKLTQARNVAMAGPEAAYERGGITQDYGINSSGGVDTTNPYSRAAIAQLTHDNAQRGAQNSMDVFSGAYQNQRGINDNAYSTAFDQLQRGAAQAFHGVGQQQLQTYAGGGVGDADFASLLKSVYPGS